MAGDLAPASTRSFFQGLQPMEAARVQEAFDSPDWLFELKWGGVRTLALIEAGQVVLRAQNGVALTEAYPEMQALARQLQAESAILDGEIVALSDEGYPDLELLRPRLNLLLGQQEARLPRAPLSYQVTDILSLDGVPLLEVPLWQRKNVLHTVLEPSNVAHACDFIEGEGIAFYEAVSQHRLEGIIAKHKQSFYHPGQRTHDWLEVPAAEMGHLVIGGYTFGGAKVGNRPVPFDSLLLGAYQGGRLVYAGRATAGLTTPEGWRTVRLLEDLHTAECPFADPPSAQTRFIYWCEPRLVCQVRQGEKSPEGELRFAVFVSLRPDLAPQDCRLE